DAADDLSPPEEPPRGGYRSGYGRPARRQGTWENVAGGCTMVQVGAIIYAATQLVVTVLVHAVKPNDLVSLLNLVFTSLIVAHVGLLVAAICGMVGRGAGKKAPDLPAAGSASVGLVLGVVCAIMSGLALVVVLLLRFGVVTNPNAGKALGITLMIAMLAA